MSKLVFSFLIFILTGCMSSQKPFVACLNHEVSGNNCQIFSGNGQVLHSPQLNSSIYRSGEDFRVNTSNIWRIVDANGQIKFSERVFDHLGELSSGVRSFRVSIMDKDKSGYLNESGEILIPALYDESSVFSEGLAAVRKIDWNVPLNWRTGYINITNQLTIDFDIIGWGNPFHDGLAIVSTYDEKKKFSDQAYSFSEQMGLINKLGQPIVAPCDYKIIWLGDERWLVTINLVEKSDPKCLFKEDTIINTSGKSVSLHLRKLRFEKILDRDHLLFHPSHESDDFEYVIINKISGQALRSLKTPADLAVGKVLFPSVITSDSDYYIYDIKGHYLQRKEPYKYIKQVGPQHFLVMDVLQEKYQYALIDSSGAEIIPFSDQELLIEFGSELISEPKSDQLFDNDWRRNLFKRRVSGADGNQYAWYNILGELVLQK